MSGLVRPFIQSNMIRPKYLVLPSIAACRFPPRLILRYRDLGLGRWEDVELLAIPASELLQLKLMDPIPPTGGVQSALAALSTGQVPDAEVPRLAGNFSNPEMVSRMSLADALVQLGYEWIPVLATADAATWLRNKCKAVEPPKHWRLEVE